MKSYNLSDLDKEIITFISKKLNFPLEKITINSSFSSDLGISSYQALELICDFEEQFECDIPDEEIGKLQKVSDLIDFIKKQKNI